MRCELLAAGSNKHRHAVSANDVNMQTVAFCWSLRELAYNTCHRVTRKHLRTQKRLCVEKPIGGLQTDLWNHRLVAGKVNAEVWNGHSLVLLCRLVGVDRPGRHNLQKGKLHMRSRAACYQPRPEAAALAN